ncbi:helix-turn-helix transcriptional regulator [bacterium SCSIO 12741]|nr:helix-turn-helix transcriptional regulator [bacterium SCSIO 12741]
MKEYKDFRNIKSVSEAHKILGLNKPKHPSISLVQTRDIDWNEELFNKSYIWDFYMISLKFHSNPLLYGRNYYDYEEGTLVFTSPGQVITPTMSGDQGPNEGWILFIHADLFRHTPLGSKIGEYSFFSYAANEGLHLSEEEKLKICSIVEDIEKEYSQNLDRHSQTLLVSNLELLLNHCTRSYDRQFYTRSPHQKDIITVVDEFIINYIDSQKSRAHGIPTVKQCAEKVNLSPNYLSDLLKKEIGKSTQELIHFHLIEKAKNLLLTSQDSVSTIAYDLGFEYPQYFGNLFKKKTGMSPMEFRQLN